MICRLNITYTIGDIQDAVQWC